MPKIVIGKSAEAHRGTLDERDSRQIVVKSYRELGWVQTKLDIGKLRVPMYNCVLVYRSGRV